MTMLKFHPEQTFADPNCVAVALPGSEVFGLMRRRINLPAQWAALIQLEDGGVRVTSPGGIADGADADDVLFVRTTPLNVTQQHDAIAAADGYLGRFDVRFRVAVIPEPGELQALHRNIVGSAVEVTTSAIGSFLDGAVRRACQDLGMRMDAATLTDAASADAMTAAVADAVRGACFQAGLALVDDPSVSFVSPAYERVRAADQDAAVRRREHEASRQLRDALQTARQEHLDRLAGTLARLKTMAEASPDADLPVLMRTFAEQERSDLYEALFATVAAERQTRAIVVATATQLLHFDPDSPGEPGRRIDIAGAAGPVRSVQWFAGLGSSGMLALGASTGVYLMGIDASTPERTLRLQDAPGVRGGFNGVAFGGGQLFASHSELGIARWRLDAEAPGETLFESMTRQAKAIRGIQVLNDHAFCAIDDRVIAWPLEGDASTPARVYTGSRATLTAVCASSAGLFAGNSAGEVLHWQGLDTSRPAVIHAGGQRGVESIWLASAGGVQRLIYTDTSLCVYSRVMGDTFACRYEASGQTLRRVDVAPDLITATNDLRDRLLHWRPGRPAEPYAMTHVGRLTGHSVQDVCLVGKKVSG